VVGSKAEELKPGPERRPSGWEPSGAKITCERNIPQATRNSKAAIAAKGIDGSRVSNPSVLLACRFDND